MKPNRGVRRKQVSMVSEEGTGEVQQGSRVCTGGTGKFKQVGGEGTGEVQQGSEEVEFRRKAKCLRGDRREQLESSS